MVFLQMNQKGMPDANVLFFYHADPTSTLASLRIFKRQRSARTTPAARRTPKKKGITPREGGQLRRLVHQHNGVTGQVRQPDTCADLGQ